MVFKKILSVGLAVTLGVVLSACGNRSAQGEDAAYAGDTVSVQDETAAPESKESVELNIAYQYGLAYAPLMLMQNGNLIEKAYEEATGNTVTVVWNQMSSGADINTGIASDNIQVGFMGVGPAITGIMNNVGYKVFTNLSGQEHGLMTNASDITTMEDLIGSDKQIALVNIGSIQHIILARALDNMGFDAHALDANLVAMKHPDGMAALQTGAIPCHLTSNPYIYKEREDAALHEIEGISDVWTIDSSFIVGVASTKLYEENRELYDALCSAAAEAIDRINGDMEAAAAITCEYNGNTFEDELKYLQAGRYTAKTSGIFELAKFMADKAFIDTAPETYFDLAFENVQGD